MLEDAEDEDDDDVEKDRPREKENFDENVRRKLLPVSLLKLTLPSDVDRDGCSLSPPPL